MDIVILGADEPLGRAYLEDCLNNPETRVVGIGLSSPASLSEHTFENLKDLRAIALGSGTYDAAPEGISVYIGDGSYTRLVENLKPERTALCLYGRDSYRCFNSLVRMGTTILLGDSDSVLVGDVKPAELAEVEILDPRISEGLKLAEKAGDGDFVDIVYSSDPRVESTPAETLFKLSGPALVKEGEDARGAIQSALFLRAYADLAVLARLSGKPISTFHAVIEPSRRHAALLSRKDGTLLFLSGDELVSAEEDVKPEQPSYELYPMLYFLTKMSGKFGWRGDIAIQAASEAAVESCARGRIDLSSAETIIRQVASSACRSLKTPADESQASEMFDTVLKQATSLADRIANARENGTSAEAVKRSKKLNKEKVESERESEEEHREHKKATRWKNDPEKKDLWEQHQRAKQVRAKRKAENERRASRRVHAVKEAAADRGNFPVAIVDDERRDREEHLRRRENPRRSFHGDSHRSFDKPYRSERRGGFKGSDERRGFSGGRSFHGPRKNDHFSRSGEGSERRSEGAGERRSYSSRGKSFGDRKSFSSGRKPFGEKRNFGDRKPSGDRKSFRGGKSFGDRKGFSGRGGSRHTSSRPGFNRGPRRDGQRGGKPSGRGFGGDDR